MPSPKHIVITGSTRGIGCGLAEAFLRLGCAVTVSGRGVESTAAAAGQLATKYDPAHVYGFACELPVPRRGRRCGSSYRKGGSVGQQRGLPWGDAHSLGTTY